jgi:hypothetical protein
MTAETENAAREKTAARRFDEGSARAGTVEPLTRADPLTRQRVLYGVVAYAVARLAWDRRFQASVIMVAIGLAVAKSALKDGTKDIIVGVERYYLHVEPGLLHLHGRRGQRRAA